MKKNILSKSERNCIYKQLQENWERPEVGLCWHLSNAGGKSGDDRYKHDAYFRMHQEFPEVFLFSADQTITTNDNCSRFTWDDSIDSWKSLGDENHIKIMEYRMMILDWAIAMTEE